MNKNEIKKMIEVSENLGWNVNIDGEEFTFSQCTPACQDYSFTLVANNIEELSEKMKDYYNNYDVSYEAYLCLGSDGHGTNGAPYDMKDVYEDMAACEEMTRELSEEIEKLV